MLGRGRVRQLEITARENAQVETGPDRHCHACYNCIRKSGNTLCSLAVWPCTYRGGQLTDCTPHPLRNKVMAVSVLLAMPLGRFAAFISYYNCLSCYSLVWKSGIVWVTLPLLSCALTIPMENFIQQKWKERQM